ncbi:hypothetical protein K1T71_012534 [Dendrolimus kikuchii]|uniref:Uncharacterized protein n=1 Tax=Dendrolimus kikuchii TaxID=765133 RepID=A0ACC1CK07_9NEOP|nr:hypothetical protein K1T71_012534 [Dendrolimus kikuchii]
MKTAVIILAIMACVHAQVSMPPHYKEMYPEYYKFSKVARHPRDVSWDTQVGGGKVFGTLGQNDQGLFGKGGYQKEFFNDDRGKLSGQAYGSRVLGPNGDSSSFGGRFDWADQNAKAAIDLNRQIGGRSSIGATGEGVWNFDKNTRLSAGGSVFKEFGHRRPDVGFQAQFEKSW